MEDNRLFLGSLEIENETVKERLCNCFENEKDSIIRDTYDIENNIITKRIGRAILTGNENWRYDFDTKTFAYCQENKFNEDGLGKFDKMLSNYFRWQSYDSKIKESMFQGNDKGEIMFKFYDGIEDVEIFKKWIIEKYSEGNPVEVYFALQYPVIMKMEKIYNWCYLNKLTREFSHISVDSGEVEPILNIRSRTINRRK